MRAKKGFTLVEILIVVVILGILAAIVIPQFTDASTEAKTSSLCSDLQTVRSQIELYKIQHNDNLPDMEIAADDGDNDLTRITNVSGTEVAAGTANSFGPYLQKMPKNAFNNSTTVVIVDTAGADPNASVGTGENGWYFNSVTGAFHAIDSDEHSGL